MEGSFIAWVLTLSGVLFRYVISSLELLVAEDYMIICLNGATPRRKMPGINWLKRCYQMIDRRYSGGSVEQLLFMDTHH